MKNNKNLVIILPLYFMGYEKNIFINLFSVILFFLISDKLLQIYNKNNILLLNVYYNCIKVIYTLLKCFNTDKI